MNIQTVNVTKIYERDLRLLRYFKRNSKRPYMYIYWWMYAHGYYVLISVSSYIDFIFAYAFSLVAFLKPYAYTSRHKRETDVREVLELFWHLVWR